MDKMFTRAKPLLLFFSVSGVVGGVEVYIRKKWMTFNRVYRVVCVIGKSLGVDYLKSVIPDAEVIQFPFTSVSRESRNILKVLALLSYSSISIIHSNDLITNLWAKAICSLLFWKRIANVATIHSVLTEHRIFSPRAQRIIFSVFRFFRNVKQYSTICVSKQVYASMKALGFATCKSLVIYHGVDSADRTLEHGRSRAEKHPFALVFVGRLSLEKGPDIFVDVVRRVRALLLDSGNSLTVRGDMYGDGKERERLMSLIVGAGIELKGFVQDIEAAYGSADAVCITSRTESFSFVLFEALARKVPVFVLRLPVFEEITSFCPYSRLMLCDDADEMARKLASLIDGSLSFDFQRIEGLLMRFSRDCEKKRLVELYAGAVLGQSYYNAQPRLAINRVEARDR
jgi:glycosyltransferase involved in cell wall biosynthesis